jgi:hypothetical protein
MENSSPEIEMIVLLASSSPEIFFGFDGGGGGGGGGGRSTGLGVGLGLEFNWVLSLSLSFLVARPRIHMRFIAFQAPKSAADLGLCGAGIDFFSQ